MLKSSRRMLQLDGLRTIAVAAVAFSHWAGEGRHFVIPWGTGVQLFFVLSGFLITGILFANRSEARVHSVGGVLRTFYMRRFLRIFPLYYGVIAVCVLLQVWPITHIWPWHFTYLSNFYYFHLGVVPQNDHFRHFWSLAVEEQFYLLWPLLMLALPERWLPRVLWASIIGAVLFRMSLVWAGYGGQVSHYLLPSCLDALGLGALLAWVKFYRSAQSLSAANRWCLLIGLGGLVVALGLKRVTHAVWFDDIGHTCLIVFYGYLVGRGSEGFRGPFGAFLEFKPVVYLGAISYGLYVYHLLAPVAVEWMIHRLGHGEGWLHSLPKSLALYGIFTVVVSALSWHLYEAPLNRLKDRFRYRPASRKTADQLPVGTT